VAVGEVCPERGSTWSECRTITGHSLPCRAEVRESTSLTGSSVSHGKQMDERTSDARA